MASEIVCHSTPYFRCFCMQFLLLLYRICYKKLELAFSDSRLDWSLFLSKSNATERIDSHDIGERTKFDWKTKARSKSFIILFLVVPKIPNKFLFYNILLLLSAKL